MRFLLAILLLLPSICFADDISNNGGIFNKGFLFCASAGTGCVKAKQANVVAGITDNGDGSIQILSGGGGSGGVNAGTLGTVPVYVGISTVGSSANVYIQGNNLGIGTVGPTSALQVVGTATATAFSGPLTGNVTGNVSGNAGTAAALAANGTNCSAGNYPLGVDASGNSENCTTAATGTVTSIATTSPITGGPITASGTIGINTTGIWNGNAVTATNSTTVTTNANLTGPITSVGNATSIAAQTGTGTTFVTQASPTLTTPVIGDATGTSLTTTGNVGIGTTLSLTTAGLSVMSGNVGIGTWKPVANFDIRTGTPTLTMSGSVDPVLTLSDTSNPDTANFLCTNLLCYTGTTTNTNFALRSNAVARMTIQNNGNIGIGTNIDGAGLSIMNGNVGLGTWVPSQPLDVTGVIRSSTNIVATSNIGIGTLSPNNNGIMTGRHLEVRDNSSTNNMGLYVGSTSGSPSVVLSADTSQKLNFITFYDNNGGNTETSKASFGLNRASTTVTGAARNDFTIYTISGAGTKLMLSTESTGSQGITINSTGNVGVGTVVPGNSFQVLAGKFDVTSAGNVGIGTILPQGKLHIKSAGGSFISQQATAPTVASNDCGTTSQGTIVAGSTDLSGTVTVGTLAVTSCAVSFNTAFNAAPNCICMDDSNVLAVRCTATTTKLTITSLSSMSSDLVTWWCPGNF